MSKRQSPRGSVGPNADGSTGASPVPFPLVSSRGCRLGGLHRFVGASRIGRAQLRAHIPIVNNRRTEDDVLDGSVLPADDHPGEAQREGKVEGRAQQGRDDVTSVRAACSVPPHTRVERHHHGAGDKVNQDGGTGISKPPGGTTKTTRTKPR